MPGTGIVRDPLFLAHGVRNDHPENGRRLAAIYDLLDRPAHRGRFVEIDAQPVDREAILQVHAAAYVDRIAATQGRDFTQLTPDTHACADTFRATLTAVGGLFAAVARVVGGDLTNAFALTRPPGHHAERSRAMGYCIFNNVALAAWYARRTLGLQRVLIVDWDVHHGNGTQHAFENEPTVLFFSVHQHPHFPGTGLFTESGHGAGEGYTVNLPLPRGYGDAEYAAIFETLLKPLAEEFRPELILVSAGFDTHRDDPMGNMRMSQTGFAVLTRCLMRLADSCCHSRLVLCLEGGYNVEATAASVMAVLDELAGRSLSDPAPLIAQAQIRKLAPAVKRFRHVQRRFWKCMG